MKFTIAFTLIFMLQQTSFKQKQLEFDRVTIAYEEKEEIVKNLFAKKGLSYNGFTMFLRAFKKERQLEVWVKEKGNDKFVLLHTYDFCSTSGILGPKRKEGDLQIPEGIYHINHFNPSSNFHLSLGISYPNASDKILSDPKHPGSAIYIHGNCVTIGCIPITDDKIKELYILAVEARNNGQENIPIHIFPSFLNDDAIKKLNDTYSSSPSLLKFWKNLKPIYQDFEETRMLKKVSVNNKGEYLF